MTDLSTKFAGLTLRTPIIAASAPPTESVDAIRRCADAGIGAVVTKSIVNYSRSDFAHIPRRAMRDRSGQWFIQGSFSSETLTLNEGLKLFNGLAGRVEIPVIASIGVLIDDPEVTALTCLELQNAGASMIHLDLFYLPHPRATNGAIANLISILRAVRATCSIPITAKLNVELPVHLIAPHLNSSLLDGIFLLDSIRVPPPLNKQGDCAIPYLTNAIECSLFGSWQKPQTLQYTRLLAERTSLPICAGGGFQNANDILDSITLGATTAQFATQLMIHGAPWITKTTSALETALVERGYTSIEEFTCSVRNKERLSEGKLEARAIISQKDCTDCGVCVNLMFCSYISQSENCLPVISDDCYGCGFCKPLCPARAIQIVPLIEVS